MDEQKLAVAPDAGYACSIGRHRNCLTFLTNAGCGCACHARPFYQRHND